MRIFHFILGKANKERANGVNQVIAGLAKYTARAGADVRVVGLAESVSHQGELIPRDGFAVMAYSHVRPHFLREIRASIQWADVVHLHGVFSPWNVMVAATCRKIGRPYVVTLHDGLANERVRGRIGKQMFHAAVQRRFLSQAAGIHVLTEEEATDAFSSFAPRRIFCVPNGVDLDDFPAPERSKAVRQGEATFGYIGRLSPEKNIEAVCRAIAQVRSRQPASLVLGGPDSLYLRHLLSRYGENGTSWVGPKFGADKLTFLRGVDAFVHPSLCDVFSIAAMEALAVGTPLLITRTANASYFFDRKAFFMCEPTVYGLQNGIERMMSSRAEWPAFAARGRDLIEQEFNWSIASAKLLKQYADIIEAQR